MKITKKDLEKMVLNEIMSTIPVEMNKVSPEVTDKEILRIAIIAELDATSLYEQLAANTENEKIKKVLLDIAKEEKTHVGEFQALLLELDGEQEEELEKGEDEVEEMGEEMEEDKEEEENKEDEDKEEEEEEDKEDEDKEDEDKEDEDKEDEDKEDEDKEDEDKEDETEEDRIKNMRPEDLFEIKKLQKRIKETNLIMKITKKQIQKLVKEEIIRYKKIKSLQEKKEHIKKQLGEIHNKEEEKTNNKMLKEWFLKNKKNNKEEDLIIGIDKLQNLLNVIGHEMTFELNHKFYDIKEVNDKGIKTDSKFIGWQYINDRYPSEEKGLMILMDDDEYFYFKLTEEERERHPYNNWEEHEADLQDKFNDNEDDDIINHI